MRRKPVYVDVHIIQTVPPSNLNRDDAGSPKQAVYGGVRRARVSSQAWKRATRLAFLDLGTGSTEGATRTKRISGLLKERLVDRFALDDEQATRISTHLLAPLKIKPGKKEAADTAYLLFFGKGQLDAVADLIADRVGELAGLDESALESAIGTVPVVEQFLRGHPADVALFGRMVADLPRLNVDAATQVAHAISTHSVDIEFDYYTAVDDEKTRDEDTGAGMIGTIEFNSATLYRYATVGVHQLLDNLDGDDDAAGRALRLFLEGFTRSIPSGHQNSFAHRTLPSLVAAIVRDDQPVNLVSAFEDPIRVQGGIAEESIVRLSKEQIEVLDRWGGEPLQVSASYRPVREGDRSASVEAAFGPSLPFSELVERTSLAALQAARAGVTS